MKFKFALKYIVKRNFHFLIQPGYFCQGHAPVIDGEGNFMPEDPLTQRAKGEFSPVPLLSGWNSEDGSVYALACK